MRWNNGGMGLGKVAWRLLEVVGRYRRKKIHIYYMCVLCSEVVFLLSWCAIRSTPPRSMRPLALFESIFVCKQHLMK